MKLFLFTTSVFHFCILYTQSLTMEDPSNKMFDWSISECKDGYFRRLLNGVEECKKCYKPTMKHAYTSSPSLSVDEKFQHGACCANPSHHVCMKMNEEYKRKCDCSATENEYCFENFNPYGVNVLHMDLSLIEGSGFSYTDQAAADYRLHTPLPDGYDRNSRYYADVAFTSISEGSPSIQLMLPVENQQMIIDCSPQGVLAPWCQSCLGNCVNRTAHLITPFLHIYDEDAGTFLDWTYNFGATLLNRFGVPGDEEFTIVDLAREHDTWIYAMTEYPHPNHPHDFTTMAVLFHDALLREFNIATCFTPPGGTCESSGSRRRLLTQKGKRHKLLGRRHGKS